MAVGRNGEGILRILRSREVSGMCGGGRRGSRGWNVGWLGGCGSLGFYMQGSRKPGGNQDHQQHRTPSWKGILFPVLFFKGFLSVTQPFDGRTVCQECHYRDRDRKDRNGLENRELRGRPLDLVIPAQPPGRNSA